MADARRALEAERDMEREFVAEAFRSETQPKGWPAAIVMFHVSMWRERLRNGLNEFRHARPYTAPPEDIDDFNDSELASGIGTPLADAAGRSQNLLAELIALSDELGDRPFNWYTSTTTVEALLRNSYTHPRLHIVAYWRENGERDRANQLFEDAMTDMREAAAPPTVMGVTHYNLACARVAQDRMDDALEQLSQAFSMRADLKEGAVLDEDLAPLRENPGFQALVKG